MNSFFSSDFLALQTLAPKSCAHGFKRSITNLCMLDNMGGKPSKKKSAIVDSEEWKYSFYVPHYFPHERNQISFIIQESNQAKNCLLPLDVIILILDSIQTSKFYCLTSRVCQSWYKLTHEKRWIDWKGKNDVAMPESYQKVINEGYNINDKHAIIFPKSNPYDPTVRVCLLGAMNVGKSASLIQFINGIFVEKYDAYVEDSYRKMSEFGNSKDRMIRIMYELYDFQWPLDQLLFDTIDTFMIFYSIASEKSLIEAKQICESVLARVKADGKYRPAIILIGNKVDLEHCRRVSYNDGLEVATELEIPFLEHSAKSRYNNDIAFYLAAELLFIIRRIFQ